MIYYSVQLPMKGLESVAFVNDYCDMEVESIPTPVVDPSSSLQLPALTPTISPNSIELTSATINAGTTNSKYTSLHTTPPSLS